MKTRYVKTNIFFFIISYILLLSFMFFTSYKFFLTNFITLEKIQNDNNIKTFLTTIDSELKNLKNTTNDYSNWDDTYKFIQDENKEYIYENFREGSQTLANLDIDGIIYVNDKNRVIYSIYENNEIKENKDKFEKLVLSNFTDKKDLNMVINFNSKFIYFSKSQILRSDLKGDYRGYIVTVKFLNNEFMDNNPIFHTFEISNKKLSTYDDDLKLSTFENIKIKTETTLDDIINTISFFNYDKDFIISIITSNKRDLVKSGEETIFIFNFIVSVVLFLIFFFIYKNQWLIQNQNEMLNKEVEKRTKQLDKAFRKLKNKNRELYNLAHIDTLTRIRNRRSFFIDSIEALENSIKKNKEFCVLLIDLDHFKSINDTYGHASGDRVLIEFCNIINEIIDEKAIFGRIGGEEFCITFINKSIDEITNIAETIRNNCANTKIILEDNKVLTFTVSMGLSCRDGLDDIDKILHKSDELLYEAKKTGRNRLIRNYNPI